jgi:hypothetical protein
MPRENKAHWIDEPECLPERLKDKRDAARAMLTEARTYTQMYYDVPASIADDPSAKILDTKGMRELGWNLVAEMVRAAKAQIVKPLTAVVVPVGGNWEQKLACRSLGQVIDAVLDQVEFTKVAEQLVVDGMLVPSGGHVLLECHPRTKDIGFERLEPTEVFFTLDRTEVLFTRFPTRRQAKARYAGKDKQLRKWIDELPAAEPEHIVGVDSAGQFKAEDLIKVEEGYALPVGDEPGKHVVVIGKRVFIDEDLTEKELPVLPIASFVWDSGHRGDTDGKPLARSIAGQHSWLQELIWKMYDSLAGAVPWVENAPEDWEPSDVPHQRVPAGLDGQPVKVHFPQGISQDVRSFTQDIQAGAARATGISEQSSESAVPASLTTGLAIANWKSVTNEGVAPQHRKYDALWSQAGKICLALMQRFWGNDRKARQKAVGSDVINQIDFSSITLPEAGVQLSFDVVSGLGQRIPQKVQLLELAHQKGLIGVGKYFQLLGLPDFKAASKRFTAPDDFIEYQISQALDHGKVVAPCEFQDAAALAREAGNAWQAARVQSLPPAKGHLEACRTLYRLARARAKAAPTDPAAMGVPGELPAPAPAAASIAQPLTAPMAQPPTPPTTNGPSLPLQ